MEWKLFDPENPPQVADTEFLRKQPWMRLEAQPGFAQRMQMVGHLVDEVFRWAGSYVYSVTDLGCGDGAMLRFLHTTRRIPKNTSVKGYDLGASDIEHATQLGPDEYRFYIADISAELGVVQLGALNIMTEVLEHMVSPHKFLADLRNSIMSTSMKQAFLLATSPSLETGEWHNDIHLWAWDQQGYQKMFRDAGWDLVRAENVAGGTNTFNGVTRDQAFQGLVAVVR